MAVADPHAGPASSSGSLPPRRLGAVAIAAALLVAADQLTKWWAVSNLSDGHAVDVIGSLRFTLAFNTGMAFSFGDGRNLGPLVALLALAVVVGLIVGGTTTRTRSGAVAVGLIAGGALGNLSDRAFREGPGFLGGGVVDFIDLQWWPVFNVADSAIVLGAIFLVLLGSRAPAGS